MKHYLSTVVLIFICGVVGAQSIDERKSKAISEIDKITLRLDSIPPSQRGWTECFRMAYLQLYDLGDIQGAFDNHIKGMQYATRNGFVPIFDDNDFYIDAFRGTLTDMSMAFFSVMCRFESEYRLSTMLEEYFKDNYDDELYLFLRLHLPLVDVGVYKDPLFRYNLNIQNDYYYLHWIEVQDKLVNILREKDRGLSMRLFSALKTQAFNYSVLRFIDKAKVSYDEAFRVADKLLAADINFYVPYDVLSHDLSIFYGSIGEFERQIEVLDKERELHIKMHGNISSANRSVMLRLADAYQRLDPKISDSLRIQAQKIDSTLNSIDSQPHLADKVITDTEQEVEDYQQSSIDVQTEVESTEDNGDFYDNRNFMAYLDELKQGAASADAVEQNMDIVLKLLSDDGVDLNFKRTLIELHDKAIGDKYNMDIPYKEVYLLFLTQYPKGADSIFRANLMDKLVHGMFKNTGKSVGYLTDISLLSVLEYIIVNQDSLPPMDYQTRQFIFEQFLSLKFKDVASSFRTMTQDEREAKWGNTSKLFEFGPESAYRAGDTASPMIGHIMNAAILSKELLLNSSIALRKLILDSGDLTIIEAYAEFEKLSKETMGINDALSRKKLFEIEKKLIVESDAFGDYLDFMRVQWQDILHSLNDDELAVEFVDFDYYSDRQYAAIILGKDYRQPIMVPLFSIGQLDRAISSAGIYRGADGDIYSNPEICKVIWSNLAPYLDGVKAVYFSPSGEMHRMAIEYMPVFNAQGNICQNLNFYRISSTRQLYNRSRKKEIGDGAVLYGGISYDDSVQAYCADAEYTSSATRDLKSNMSQSGITLSYLPGSKEEIDNIEKILISDSILTAKYDNIYATAPSFKSLNEKRIKIIHIATHGFFIENEKQKLELGLADLLRSDSMVSYEDRNLINNGLFFAGANSQLRYQNERDMVADAIMTARDISLLDLRGLDLVVLSACQSALGKVNGEGVFGLQRGFKKAGAQTILMSLWPVNDRATQILMSEFYDNLIEGRRSKREAFHTAQQNLRNWEQKQYVEIAENDTSKPRIFNPKTKRLEYPQKKRSVLQTTRPFSNSRYWAAFIMLDDIK